jgi:hypothetical protein
VSYGETVPVADNKTVAGAPKIAVSRFWFTETRLL